MNICKFKDQMLTQVCGILENIDNKVLVQYYASHLLVMIEGFEVDVDVKMEKCICDCKVYNAIKQANDYDSNLLTP